MLSDGEVRRIIDAIGEYKELVEQSTDMRDKLESLQKRWNGLRQDREQIRNALDSQHQNVADESRLPGPDEKGQRCLCD